MKFLFAFLLGQCLCLQTASGSLFSETLTAQGLLGSHFGVPGLPGSFDYVVIGGGTAGLTVARRLAVNFSVAVIEAGDFYEFSNGNLSEIPGFTSDFTGTDPAQKNPYLDWYQYTEPQPTLDGDVFLYDSGKLIGGTSGRSFLWQIRGTVGTFSKWATQVNDSSYTFDNMLRYFQKSYSFYPPNNSERPANASATFNTSDWSPSGEPLKVTFSSWVNPVSAWLGLSFKELGFAELPSLLSGKLLGWSWLSVTLDPVTQTRSSAEAFLRASINESQNLVMYKNTMAKKIVFEDGTAVGVAVNSGGVAYNISANKEVILSAGVIRSPQLLMVSGIGQKDVLENLSIEVISELQGVGQNLWDNVLVGPTYAVDVLTHNSLVNPAFLAQSVNEFNTNRTGMLTNVGGDIAAFEKLEPSMVEASTYQSLQENFPEDWPHVEYLVLDAYFGAGTNATGIANGQQYVAASVGLVATFSRGNVTISSPDTSVNPIVSPNWLSDPRDQDIAIAAFKRGRQLFSTQAISPIVQSEAFPGANITTDAQILEVIRSSANSVYNPAGTNAMGSSDDRMAVVDSQGRVFGVQGLRVVDASIFPFLPPGQPIATVYAIAEKIAEDILINQS